MAKLKRKFGESGRRTIFGKFKWGQTVEPNTRTPNYKRKAAPENSYRKPNQQEES